MFGFGAEARKVYREATLKPGRLIRVTLREFWPSTSPLSWPTTLLWNANLQQRPATALPLVQPDAPQITPYISIIPPDDDPQVLTSSTMIQPPNRSGNKIDMKRQERVPSREPARRLSIHKPALAALDPAIAIPSVSSVPLRRISHHKPPFVPLAPPNALATATPGASGSTPLRARVEAANTIRGQRKLASHTHTCRLSYYKPAFVSLAPANASRAAPNPSEPRILLVDIPKDSIGNKNAVVRPESVVDGGVALPPLSSPSTSTVPPPLSTPYTATPAPPYQEVNSFLEYAR